AITLITVNLKRQTRLAKKWVEEAENWGNELITSEDIKPSSPKTSLKMEGLPEGPINQQADERNGAANGRSVAQAPAITAAPEGEGLGMAAAAATAVLDRSRVEKRPVKAEIAREFSEDRANVRSENKDNLSSTDDDVFARYRHLIESPFSPMATFHQLPPPLPEFVGRLAELVGLYAARADHAMHVLRVQGPGGRGSTTLALR